MNRLSLCLLLLPVCLLAPGCIENVWLPDSSGFVCITLEHTLVHYDLTKKTGRVIVKHDWLHADEDVFERPAASPDGKQVAIVRHVSSKDAETVQILVYDLASGKETLKTKELPLPGHADFSPQPLVRSGAAFWSPDGQRILFEVSAPLFRDGKPLGRWYGGSEPGEIATMGFYDLGTKKHQAFTNLSLDEETLAVGLSPFTPDGRGFIAGRSAKEPGKPSSEATSAEAWTSMVFIEWSGREHTFKVAPEVIEATDKERRDTQRTKPGADAYRTDVPICRWEKNVCLLPLDKGVVRLDPVKLTITYERNATCAQRLEYARKHNVDVLGWKDDLLVQFREVAPDVAAPTDPAAKPPAKPIDIELLIGLDLATGKAEKLVKVARVDDIDSAMISPNGEYLLLRCAADSADGVRIRRMVINTKGEKVLDVTEKTVLKHLDPSDAPPAPAPPPPAPAKPGAPKPPEA